MWSRVTPVRAAVGVGVGVGVVGEVGRAFERDEAVRRCSRPAVVANQLGEATALEQPPRNGCRAKSIRRQRKARRVGDAR